jgi:hypothetical protein
MAKSDFGVLADVIMRPSEPYRNPCIGCDKHVPYGNICETCVAAIDAARSSTDRTLPDLLKGS